MTNQEFIDKAKELVKNYAIEHLVKSDGPIECDVYVVWSCKTLQNSKALVSTSLHDGVYYEITLNGDKNEIYLDVYKKLENRVYSVC